MPSSLSVLKAIDAACGTMSRIFDENGMPLFVATVWPQSVLAFNSWHAESHVPGRHLNALLLAESIGRPINEAAIEAHRRALFFSYGTELPLPFNRAEESDTVPTVFIPHNIREGFHGLHALARYRDDPDALALIDRSVAYLLDHWNPADGWDPAVPVQGYGGADETVSGIGRALGPLVKILDLTGDDAVRRLVDLVATKLLSDHYLPDGEFVFDRFRSTIGIHVHSITSSLSSLAQYARLTGDDDARRAVKAFYDRGAWAFRDQLGWARESSDGVRFQGDRGETNTTGDLLETALILADDGDTSYLDDAERIIYSHLLPSQVRDVTLFSEHPDDTMRKLEGSWGFPAPYGYVHIDGTDVAVMTDVVGGTSSSLCVAVAESVAIDEGMPTVRLYLDAERHGVRASLEGATARVSAGSSPVAIRVPRFDGTSGGYETLEPASDERRVDFPLEPEVIVLRHPDRDIRARVFGSRVEAMDSFGMPFPFFPPMPE
jgi:hypothetical protein